MEHDRIMYKEWLLDAESNPQRTVPSKNQFVLIDSWEKIVSDSSPERQLKFFETNVYWTVQYTIFSCLFMTFHMIRFNQLTVHNQTAVITKQEES